jgi:hypothetical protein
MAKFKPIPKDTPWGPDHPIYKARGKAIKVKKLQKGGEKTEKKQRTKIYTDLAEFKKADRAYRDSIYAYNLSQDIIKNDPVAKDRTWLEDINYTNFKTEDKKTSYLKKTGFDKISKDIKPIGIIYPGLETQERLKIQDYYQPIFPYYAEVTTKPVYQPKEEPVEPQVEPQAEQIKKSTYEAGYYYSPKHDTHYKFDPTRSDTPFPITKTEAEGESQRLNLPIRTFREGGSTNWLDTYQEGQNLPIYKKQNGGTTNWLDNY